MAIVNTADRVWHRNALKSVRGLTFEGQLAEAGLNWKVELSPIHYGVFGELKTTKHQAAYRSDTGEFIDMYTNRRPWQNEEILGRFWQFCESSSHGLQVDYLGYMTGDIVAVATMPVISDIGGDATENYLILRDSHNNGKGLHVGLFRNRIVCTNAWRTAIRGSRRSIKHIGEFNPSVIERALDAAVSTIRAIDQEQTILAETSLTEEQAYVQLVKAFGDPTLKPYEQPQLLQDILRLYKGQGAGSNLATAFHTAYGLLQACTEHYNWGQKGSQSARGFGSVLSGARNQKMSQFTDQLVSTYCNPELNPSTSLQRFERVAVSV